MKQACGQEPALLLDQTGELRRRDPGGMLRFLESFPDQLLEAVKLRPDRPAAAPGEIQNVLFCGMGGSAIGADLLLAWLGGALKVPLAVNRGPSIAGHVGPSTLVVACSYSGNTGETLQACRRARRAGARLASICSGGRLESRSRREGFALTRIPGGMPPRAALAYALVAAAWVLHAAGLISDPSPEVKRAAASLRQRALRFQPSTPTSDNPAKQLALRLQGKLPVIYGSQDRLAAVARRWAGQICENAKQPAFFGALPEMTHNEIVAWRAPARRRGGLCAVLLRDRQDHPLIQRQTRIVRELLLKEGDCLEIESGPGTWLGRLCELTLLGDYCSVYLAFLNSEDPTPVRAIDELKELLKGDSPREEGGRNA